MFTLIQNKFYPDVKTACGVGVQNLLLVDKRKYRWVRRGGARGWGGGGGGWKEIRSVANIT